MDDATLGLKATKPAPSPSLPIRSNWMEEPGASAPRNKHTKH